MAKQNNSLLQLFLDLVTIPSPSGSELAVAKLVQKYLKEQGIPFVVDNTAKATESNTGNVVAKIQGSKSQPTLLFVAHMDTVEVGDTPVKPIVKNGVISSSGDTILAADNKASVACALEVLSEVKNWTTKPTIIAVFTTREEQGKMGVSLLKLKEKVDYAFNLDGQGPLGKFVYKALGYQPFKIIIKGKSAHAAIEPEKGIHAIKIASEFVSKLQMGKDDKGNTANIGKILGGTAINAVPDTTVLEGEIRGFTETEIKKKVVYIQSLVKTISKKHKAVSSFELFEELYVPPMLVSQTHPIISFAENAAKENNLQFELGVGSFTCEGNFLSHMGYPVITVCRGGKMAHSTHESTTVKELEGYKQLILSLISCALVS